MMRTASFAIVLITLLTGCTSGLRRPVTSVTAVTDAQGIQRVTVDMHSFYFEPNRIVVKSGRPVELEVRNRAVLVPHNFSIEDSTLSVEVNQWGFGSSRVSFMPRVPGKYHFLCHVDGHAAKGMTGTLVVEP